MPPRGRPRGSGRGKGSGQSARPKVVVEVPATPLRSTRSKPVISGGTVVDAFVDDEAEEDDEEENEEDNEEEDQLLDDGEAVNSDIDRQDSSPDFAPFTRPSTSPIRKKQAVVMDTPPTPSPTKKARAGNLVMLAEPSNDEESEDNVEHDIEPLTPKLLKSNKRRATSSPGTIADNVTEMEEQPKRKPGRPRKQIKSEPAMESEFEPEEEQPKRKPGRPRKQVKSEPVMESESETKEEPPKRKPGRPKKVIKSEPVIDSDSDDKNEAEPVTPKKKPVAAKVTSAKKTETKKNSAIKSQHVEADKTDDSDVNEIPWPPTPRREAAATSKSASKTTAKPAKPAKTQTRRIPITVTEVAQKIPIGSAVARFPKPISDAGNNPLLDSDEEPLVQKSPKKRVAAKAVVESDSDVEVLPSPTKKVKTVEETPVSGLTRKLLESQLATPVKPPRPAPTKVKETKKTKEQAASDASTYRLSATGKTKLEEFTQIVRTAEENKAARGRDIVTDPENPDHVSRMCDSLRATYARRPILTEFIEVDTASDSIRLKGYDNELGKFKFRDALSFNGIQPGSQEEVNIAMLLLQRSYTDAVVNPATADPADYLLHSDRRRFIRRVDSKPVLMGIWGVATTSMVVTPGMIGSAELKHVRFAPLEGEWARVTTFIGTLTKVKKFHLNVFHSLLTVSTKSASNMSYSQPTKSAGRDVGLRGKLVFTPDINSTTTAPERNQNDFWASSDRLESRLFTLAASPSVLSTADPITVWDASGTMLFSETDYLRYDKWVEWKEEIPEGSLVILLTSHSFFGSVPSVSPQGNQTTAPMLGLNLMGVVIVARYYSTEESDALKKSKKGSSLKKDRKGKGKARATEEDITENETDAGGDISGKDYEEYEEPVVGSESE